MAKWKEEVVEAACETILRVPILQRTVEKSKAASHDQGFAEGKSVGYDEGHQAGHIEGVATGDLEGHARGYAEGFSAGEHTFRVLDDRPEFVAKGIDDSLYGPRRMRVTAVNEAQMRQEVRRAVGKEVVGKPTDEQWKMILSDHPATCVSAGAGSGKSTTLVLRVVFMVQHLGIPLESLTVISFTVASCEELRGKLARVLGFWQGREIEVDDLKHTVSTYHSLLLRLIRPAFPSLVVFEHADDTRLIRDENDNDIDNPAAQSKLNEEQLSLLHEAYATAYSESEGFRDHVHELFRREFDLRRFVRDDKAVTYETWAYTYASQREPGIIAAVRKIWSGWGLDQAKLELGPYLAFHHLGQPFFADARLGPNGPLVLFGLPRGDWPQVLETPGQKKSMLLVSALTMRLRIFSAHCAVPVLLFRDAQDLEQLETLKRLFAAEEGDDVLVAPKFEVKLPGELSHSRLTEALYQQGSFIASLGTDVPALLQDIPAWRADHSYEHHFTGALGTFWLTFERLLDAKGILPFNRAFLLATQNAPTARYNRFVLEKMRHLLVDEFQDISPLVADWLTAMQRKLLEATPGKQVSVMSIGDDWQSIYGWRGSSPELFIRFASYFRTHGDLGPAPDVKLSKNFRSIPAIVDDAAVLVDKVTHKQKKDVKANLVAASGDHGLRMMEYRKMFAADARPDTDQVANALKSIILNQYAEGLASPHKSDDVLLVMTRGNAMRQSLEKVLPERPGLAIRTYHRAKGLEADIAIMIGDCDAGPPHPFRNAVYAASGRFEPEYTYEQAKEDEAYRLAYVGVTRGKRRTHWFVADLATSFAAAAFGDTKLSEY